MTTSYSPTAQQDAGVSGPPADATPERRGRWQRLRAAIRAAHAAFVPF